MLKAGTLPSEVAQAALDALGQKRRKIALARSGSASRSVEAFFLGIGRYVDEVRNLGSRTPKSARAPEELRMVRELLGGNGTVFTRDGRIGARFPSAGLLKLAEITYKSRIYSVDSGGVIIEPPTIIRVPLAA